MSPRITIDMLAIMVQKGFQELRGDFRMEISRLDVRIDKLEERLEAKMDYQFTALSNRIDDHALNKVSRAEHAKLEKRVARNEDALELS